MKKVKIRFFKSYNSLISILLTILGFSAACDHSADEYGTPIAEYGTPHATFIVKGQVQSETDSKSISNIQVIMNLDTSYTDSNGKYVVESSNFPQSQTYLLKFKDIDGAANQEFNDLDTIVEFKDPQFTGGTGNWDAGETVKEINVKMKPQK